MKRSYIIFGYVLLLIAFTTSCCNKQSPENWSDQQAMIKAMEWQEQHPICAVAPNDWTNGAYYTGVTKAYQSTKNPIFLAALKSMGYRNEWEPYKRTYHADDVAISYAYLFLNTTRKNLVDLEPTENWLDKHLFESNKWKEGTHPTKKILWWWCDALFMAPPVINLYAVQTGDQKYRKAMHKYYTETYNLLFDEEESLFARDVRFQVNGDENDRLEENGEKIFWSRGNGWVLGGLALILQDMPKTYKHYPFYKQLFVTMAERIKDIQPEDGMWRVSLLCPETFDHGEVSGTGFFTYALAWGINNGLLNEEEYKPSVMKAWKALRNCQHKDGMIGWVQNIGDSPKPANENSWQNYGTGAFLLAGSEILKIKQ